MSSISSTTNSNLLPSWPSENNTNSLRDVSYSSYLLNTSEEPSIRRLKNINMFEDCEIDVFSADKYFNEEKTQANLSTINTEKTQANLTDKYFDEEKTQANNFSTINTEKKHFEHHQHREAVYHPRTPSNQSASSSWNSQTALLKRAPLIPSRRSNNSSSDFKRLFLSCCSFSDKTSQDIEEQTTTKSRIRTNLEISDITRFKQTIDPFFLLKPVVNSPVSARNPINMVKNITSNEQTDEKKRESLDVFGSNEFDEHGIVERRLNMLSWDTIPQVQNDEVISNGSSVSGPQSESYKDTESDQSSDLFEIDCLSCKAANPVVGSTTPATYYAPSEGSVEWSVVTASAADFSECEDERSSISSVLKHRKNTPKLSPLNRMNGMILGCKSEKAVKVAGDQLVYRTPVRERRPRNSDSAMAPVTMTRFQAEAKVPGLGPKPKKDIPLC